MMQTYTFLHLILSAGNYILVIKIFNLEMILKFDINFACATNETLLFRTGL